MSRGLRQQMNDLVWEVSVGLLYDFKVAILPDVIDNPNGDTKSIQGIPLLNQVLMEQDYDAATVLIEKHGADVNVANWEISKMAGGKPSKLTALMILVATTKISLTMVSLLLKYGAHVNAQDANGMTPLHYIVNNADIDDEEQKLAVVKLLLDAGADTSITMKTYGTPIELARTIGMDKVFPKVMALLLNK